MKHFRSDQEFINHAVLLDHKNLTAVKQAVASGDDDKAWESLLTHYRTRPAPIDPLVEQWKKNTDAFANKDSILSQLAQQECVQEFKEKGKINWAQKKAPARKDYEKYWVNGVRKQSAAGKVVFRFVLQVLKKGEKPMSVEKALNIEKKTLGKLR